MALRLEMALPCSVLGPLLLGLLLVIGALFVVGMVVFLFRPKQKLMSTSMAGIERGCQDPLAPNNGGVRWKNPDWDCPDWKSGALEVRLSASADIRGKMGLYLRLASLAGFWYNRREAAKHIRGIPILGSRHV